MIFNTVIYFYLFCAGVQTASDGEYSPVKTKKLHFKPKAKVITLPPDPNQFTNGTNGIYLYILLILCKNRSIMLIHHDGIP